MNVKNCKKCGKVFNYIAGLPICPACKERLEDKFQEVKEYVRDHRTASMNDIIDDCDVERKQVEQWVREERLIFSEESPIKFNCEKCGKTIRSGRLCDKCKKEMINGFGGRRVSAGNDTGSVQNKSNNKMYTFRRND